MSRNIFVYIALFAAAVALTACTQPAPPAKAASKPDAVDASSVVAAIRAVGAQADSSVEVHPLRDPAVDGLLKQAHDYELQQKIPQALDATAKALKIAPNSPDILQYEAELQVQANDWQQAAALAQKSWELGPKVGGLCARNLETVARARTILGDTAGATQARQQQSGCRVPPPVRL
jgi:tetratricopeptide (TPR) repeat protein